MAKQLVADFYECGDFALNDISYLRNVARKIVDSIDSIIVNESYHQFQPVGITYMAIIAKSHIAIHTWPEKKTIALDLFSCEEDLPTSFLDEIKSDFGASDYHFRMIERTLTKQATNHV